MKKPFVVVLTGAGISSGIRTFLAEDGLWEEHRVENVATPRGVLPATQRWCRRFITPVSVSCCSRRSRAFGAG